MPEGGWCGKKGHSRGLKQCGRARTRRSGQLEWRFDRRASWFYSEHPSALRGAAAIVISGTTVKSRCRTSYGWRRGAKRIRSGRHGARFARRKSCSGRICLCGMRCLWLRYRKEGNNMKRILVGIAVATSGFLGCAKSVERAQRDVQRTHNQAVRNIEKKQEELRDEKRDAEERIAQKERRLQDTAREETDKVRKEQRSLEDAVRVENRREDARRDEARRSETTPDTTAPLPPE